MLIPCHCLFHQHLNLLICTCALVFNICSFNPVFHTSSSSLFHTCSSHLFTHVLPINVSHMIHSSVSHLFFTPVLHLFNIFSKLAPRSDYSLLTTQESEATGEYAFFLHTHVLNMFFTPVFHMCSSHLPYFKHLLHTCSFVRCSGRTPSRNKCLFHTWLRMCFTPFSDP